MKLPRINPTKVRIHEHFPTVWTKTGGDHWVQRENERETGPMTTRLDTIQQLIKSKTELLSHMKENTPINAEEDGRGRIRQNKNYMW